MRFFFWQLIFAFGVVAQVPCILVGAQDDLTKGYNFCPFAGGTIIIKVSDLESVAADFCDYCIIVLPREK